LADCQVCRRRTAASSKTPPISTSCTPKYTTVCYPMQVWGKGCQPAGTIASKPVKFRPSAMAGSRRSVRLRSGANAQSELTDLLFYFCIIRVVRHLCKKSG
jgi:hypothetical protein